MSEPPDARSCQIHVDPLSGRSVFVAPARAQRPREEALDACPFCAGNEHLTPEEVLRSPADRALPWGARLVPNRYPIVVDHRSSPSAATPATPATPAATAAGHRPAHGVHDVIVESPRHDRSILAVEAPHWRASWALARQRLAQLALRDDLVWGGVFKNSGRVAGASLDHVHSQLVALDFVPPPIVAQLAVGAGDLDPFTRIIAAAEREQRVVATTADLVALVPPARGSLQVIDGAALEAAQRRGTRTFPLVTVKGTPAWIELKPMADGQRRLRVLAGDETLAAVSQSGTAAASKRA